MSNETEKKVKKISVKKITLAALFAALVTVATTVVKIPTGINDGYLHFGDSMIYLAGCLLGLLKSGFTSFAMLLASFTVFS